MKTIKNASYYDSKYWVVLYDDGTSELMRITELVRILLLQLKKGE